MSPPEDTAQSSNILSLPLYLSLSLSLSHHFTVLYFQQNEVRLPLATGIVGHVVNTGKLININNVYNHPLFYKGCDQETGFKTRNILCFPISDNDEVS